MLKHAPSQEVIEAFHTMWDNFPEPTSLVHKSTEVIAVNKCHFLEPGTYCSKTGGGPHVGCRAQKALRSGEAEIGVGHSPFEDKDMITYWIPLERCPDYFVHLSIRFRIDYENKTFAIAPIEKEHMEAMAVIRETH